MDNNQLGRNIQHLRYIHGETLEKLGSVIGYAKNTVKGYESGARKPDPATLLAISRHYDTTVDELLHTDLTTLPVIGHEDVNLSEVFTYCKRVLPLYSTEKCLENPNFKLAYEYSNRLLDSIVTGEILRGSILEDIIEGYTKAIDEDESPEAVANLLWSIFMLWTQIMDTDRMLELQRKLINSKISYQELHEQHKIESAETVKKKKEFIAGFDEFLIETIKELKTDLEWADLGDYYLALRYLWDMVDTDLSTEMNVQIGIQMMIALTQIGNQHAYDLLNSPF